MSNIKYCAFLKFKRNEVLALNDLTDELKEKISVFFDMPNELLRYSPMSRPNNHKIKIELG